MIKRKQIPFAMSENDIKALIEYKPASRWENETRRVFLIMYYTGANLEDAIGFSTDNLCNNGTLLAYTTKRHGVDVSIKKDPVLDLYLNRVYPDSKKGKFYARFIKELFFNAEITSPVFDSEGKRHKMCDVISMSVARYTFATNKYNEGYSPQQIMDMMGTTSRVFIARAIQGYKKRSYKSKRQCTSTSSASSSDC